MEKNIQHLFCKHCEGKVGYKLKELGKEILKQEKYKKRSNIFGEQTNKPFRGT